jgi:metal transporter CNNM
MVLGISKVITLTLGQLSLVQAAPFYASTLLFSTEKDTPQDVEDPSLWLYLIVAATLVLLGGAFAGLTIALMGQVRDIRALRLQHTEKRRTKYTFK